jgi:hypothetical protein
MRISEWDLLSYHGDRMLWVQGEQPLPNGSRLLQAIKLRQGQNEGPQDRQVSGHLLNGLITLRQGFLRAAGTHEREA